MIYLPWTLKTPYSNEKTDAGISCQSLTVDIMGESRIFDKRVVATRLTLSFVDDWRQFARRYRVERLGRLSHQMGRMGLREKFRRQQSSRFKVKLTQCAITISVPQQK